MEPSIRFIVLDLHDVDENIHPLGVVDIPGLEAWLDLLFWVFLDE